MTPKQLHLICDFFLCIPIIGILLSVIFFSNKLEKEIFLVKDIFAAWKLKPIHILQDSYQKTCDEIGMTDLVAYEWPGTHSGCSCQSKYFSSVGKCNENEIQLGCKTVEEVKLYKARKWKTRYLCSSSVKSKSYFDLNKVKENELCPYKSRKCGIIDTLGNHLCVPEGENCPLNSISFLNTVDENNVRIDTSNTKENGKIFSNFIVAENNICLNHFEREFAEKDFSLTNSISKYLTGCQTYVTLKDGNSYYNDKNFEKLDLYPKTAFYEHNKIFPFVIKNVPNYPTEFKSNISLFASVFTGWKRECDKKEFNQLKNNNIDSEITDIVSSTNYYNLYLIIYSLSITGLFIIGVAAFKYNRILSGNNRIEVTNSTMVLLVFIYISILIFSCLMFYIADLNLDIIKNSKLTHDFFELLTNNECSDDFTNAVLKHVTKEYFSYLNRYFNIKILSVFSILNNFILILVCLFAKSSESKNKRRPFNKHD